jgi:preprotein translocase subunit SecG
MMTLIIIIHVVACIGLIILVLIQRGRGSGLVESFAGVESLFGTKTSGFLTRTTTILSTIFFLTCLSLAVLSIRQSKSLMSSVKIKKQIQETPLSPKVLNQTQATTPAVEQDTALENSTAQPAAD